MGRLLYSLVCIIFTLAPTSAFSNLLVNGGYESPDISGSFQRYDEDTGASQDFGWVIVYPYVDHVNSLWSGISGTSNPDGYDQSIRLVALGILAQTFHTIPGQTYQLSFYYSHAPYEGDVAGAAGFLALVDGEDPHEYQNSAKTILSDHIIHTWSTDLNNMSWRQYVLTFSAVSERTTVVFINDWDYNSCVGCEIDITGFVVDDVKISVSPNLLANGDLEFSDISGNYMRYDHEVNKPPNGFGWTISFPYVDHVNSLWSGISGTSNPDGYDQSIRLVLYGTMYQTFNTIPGKTYQLTFYYSHAPYPEDISGAAGFVALLNGSGPYHHDDYLHNANIMLSEHILHSEPTSFNDMKWSQYKLTFKAVGETTTLAFQNDWDYNSCVGCEIDITGFVVDDVKVALVEAKKEKPMPWIPLLLLDD